MSLESVDKKLFANVYKLKNANNFPSINPRDIKILRLDAPCYGESNKPKIIKFQSLVVKTS